MTPPGVLDGSTARLALRILSDADVARVHATALELLGAEGAAAEAAAASAPSRIVLGARAPEQDVTLDGSGGWLASGGPADLVLPLGGGASRAATAADIEHICRLADALPEVAVVGAPPVFLPGESSVAQVARCLVSTGKHVQATAVRTAAEAEVVVRLAQDVADASGTDLRARPPISLTCTGPGGRGTAEVFAHAGLPVGFVETCAAQPTPAVADDGLAGVLARHHAGVLAACAAAQAVAPEAPFIYLVYPALAGLACSDPAASVFLIAALQLAAHCGLPASAGGTLTAASQSGWDACADTAFATMSSTAAGAGLTAGAGTLDGGRVFSAQQLVMDCEVFSWNARIAAGVPVDDETVALDEISEVGVGGNYLGRRHTRRHMRDVWRPRLLDRSGWEAWEADGRAGACEKASELARRLSREHRVAPLGEKLGAALARFGRGRTVES